MPQKDPTEPFTRVSVQEAREMLDQGGYAVVDVRNPDEWAATGHVPGAVLIPVNDLLARIDEVPTDKPVLFICAAGARSALAAEYAAAAGLEDQGLYNIEGGTNEWVAQGFPVQAYG